MLYHHYDPPYKIQYQYQLQNQSIRFDHFHDKFCLILDKMVIYSIQYNIPLQSADGLDRSLTTKAKNFLFSIALFKNSGRTCIVSILQFLLKFGLR